MLWRYVQPVISAEGRRLHTSTRPGDDLFHGAFCALLRSTRPAPEDHREAGLLLFEHFQDLGSVNRDFRMDPPSLPGSLMTGAATILFVCYE